ncbi:MAG: aminotransferase class V-fold PLP-dependent enzyme, partial [Clostridia bacterium]|nr:aminotransferase class V-fold PLP-dependent enzyme [Clostridia bacterium]
MSVINLDHAATTRPEPEVIAAVTACMRDCWANPSAAYQGASQAQRMLLQTRRTLAKLLRCDPAEIVFTSGTTGKGKGVMLSQNSVLSDLFAAFAILKIGKKTIEVLPPHHTY